MRVRLHCVLLACVFAAPVVPASAQVFFPGAPGPYERFYDEDRALSPRDVVRSLYRRYGMSRVLDVRGYGDVYQATAIDRRGLTVILTVDAFSGDIIERRVARLEGDPPMRPPQPIPGARAPAPWQEDVRPSRPVAPYDLGTGRPQDKADRKTQRRNQEARKPDATPTSPDQPPPASDTLTVPKPAPVTPAPLPDVPKGPDTAARPPAEEKAPAPAPSTAPVAPPAATEAKPADPEPPAQRQAAPAQRLPEPLIDPKTGKANPSAGDAPPVTPLDDTGKPTRKIEIVPPAGFD